MKANVMYVVEKDIPINQGKSIIKKGSSLYRTHGNYYLDGGLLPPDYQEDFDHLVEYEEKNGFNYLRPESFGNTVNQFF